MRATTLHAPGDIRLEERPDPTIEAPTDAIVRTTASCICGSDLWPYRGAHDITPGQLIGHEVVGVVEAVGDDVRDVRVGDFVIAPFCHSDGTCAHCRAGMTAGCVNVDVTRGGQAEHVRITHADGTLVATQGVPGDDMVPHLLALTDVMATGWHAAVCAGVAPGCTAVVVGDGAVGLSGVLAARALGAERIIAMSRYAPRQALAREFGATDVVPERGAEGEERIADMTDGVGADAVLECVGTEEAMRTAIAVARPGSTVGFVGVPQGTKVSVGTLFRRNVGIAGGMAPVRAYLPDLLARTSAGEIQPGRVFDAVMPLDDVAAGYAAMDRREAIKVMLTP